MYHFKLPTRTVDFALRPVEPGGNFSIITKFNGTQNLGLVSSTVSELFGSAGYSMALTHFAVMFDHIEIQPSFLSQI